LPTAQGYRCGNLGRKLNCTFYGIKRNGIADRIQGVYSGVISGMNGNGNDKENINRQFLRGIQISGNDGSVGFETIFPGHYMGRATHIHGNNYSLRYPALN
jgi:hypothetical protein